MNARMTARIAARITARITAFAVIASAPLLAFAPLLASASERPTGLDLVKGVYERAAPKDQISDLTMTLTNKAGKTRVRKIKQFSKDVSGGEKRIMFFRSPADVRNTSFMTWSHDAAGTDDDQWIYLPALKKVKRISSDGRSDYFMGSDFTYDDLGDRHPEDDVHTVIREEKLDGEDFWVVESKPKDSEYMYSRTVTWIFKDRPIGKKKVFYDEDGDELKTLEVLAFEKTKGYLIITRSRMSNTQKKHTTDMRLENLVVDGGVSARKFTERMMKRGL